MEEMEMAESSVTRRGMIGGIAAGAGAAASVSVMGAGSAQSAQKTFVLVHGTFVGGWYWRRVSDLLDKSGHKVFSPTLSGLGERSHLMSKEINLDTHIADVVNVCKWEDLTGICLVVHSYGGWVGSGVVEQIGDRISSIVWLDAYKPEDGQRPIDFTNEGFRKLVMSAADKNAASFAPPPKLPPVFVNEKDRDYVDSKLTPQPISTYLEPIKLSGAREKITRKTYIRAMKFPSPPFDKALAECKSDRSWTTLETNSYHIVMLDEPQWLADTLVTAA
jgi:pimeloyl-ACP methyl ester carboxylesterase